MELLSKGSLLWISHHKLFFALYIITDINKFFQENPYNKIHSMDHWFPKSFMGAS